MLQALLQILEFAKRFLPCKANSTKNTKLYRTEFQQIQNFLQKNSNKNLQGHNLPKKAHNARHQGPAVRCFFL